MMPQFLTMLEKEFDYNSITPLEKDRAFCVALDYVCLCFELRDKDVVCEITIQGETEADFHNTLSELEKHMTFIMTNCQKVGYVVCDYKIDTRVYIKRVMDVLLRK